MFMVKKCNRIDFLGMQFMSFLSFSHLAKSPGPTGRIFDTPALAYVTAFLSSNSVLMLYL